MDAKGDSGVSNGLGELKIHGNSLDGPRTERGQVNVTGSLTGARSNNKKQKDTGPPGAGSYKAREPTPSTFRHIYERRELPIQVDCSGSGRKLNWKVDISTVDYHHYLPVFCDGIREKTEPHCTISHIGVYDLLEHGHKKVYNVIPQLIIPFKQALETRDPATICKTLKIIMTLASMDVINPMGQTVKAGIALVPYYRQLLPILNLFKSRNVNLGDGIEYGQMKQQNLGDLIEQTLHVLETTGGEHAFINIKYQVPTYESCLTH